MAVLRASNLAKSYKQKKVVIDVSLEIRSGEIVGLLGPNGAGKTTCFYMIVGLVPADHGRITIDSRDITPLPMHGRARQGIGYLPQEASVFRKLSVRDNIMAILETRQGLSKADRQKKLEELLEEFHITHIRDSVGMALSGGERRRVEIARALAMEPAFILLDEPFAGVDPISVSDIKHIIRHLRDKGIGVLITDHNVRETLDICENAYIVSGGHIIASGNADAILANQQVKEVYLGDEFRL
ncbi:LPS export ABC transporter ATP-binding protein [Marinobacter adhaerens]|jgi:lipopolysaccharide export system ATP-binding protein|uniref:Lipopolysaccharide export system ATP-binding protein LptB n=4 Tax=Marinobacter adhaerens TaxID=1033846 RepID=A0ABX8IL39_9GAMM|nr:MULTISPECIES: LPS export ABC transporter ATP-binding protein [Marinobacter]MCR9190191.1 LPS export ABC transporter ATP-binding protein [Alteromonadaceae bacterium]MEC7728905.1 LPS export ABC transporter ATP-binding protein [Pseudomonadota bacterium]MTI76300.1 LPS export ABC transporter ATP-binding protein [Marinobacter sp.]ADP98205.1 protein containing ABC transporter-like domain [Marinobacter adhaerens HP15]MBW4977273.1 LPS export ABC transporter ATP-binding protein [Marinobacter adhaerens|tara:strand:- start:1419 stop:2144 length:726 start_codon:yes stop_codon:yes gene_type:complete